MNRKEFLKTEIEQNPSDPLNYYMLALEYRKEGQKKISGDLFDFLIEKNPQYLPTYYTYGSYLIELGEESKAELILRSGFSFAEKAGQAKMAREIQSLLDLYY
jgi:tetratricopeptide (TPR) repeat protein